MHARKLPRIGEASFDRDYHDGGGGGVDHRGSSGGGGGGNGGKGGSSSSSSRYSSKSSKMGGGNAYRRSISPDSRHSSPRGGGGKGGFSRRDVDSGLRGSGGRDNYYSSKYSRRDFSSRDRDRDRDRGRDRGRDRSPVRSSSSRKWSDATASSSSKSRDKDGDKGGGGGGNSVSNETKIRSVGEWAEFMSSSGKKYYYNSVTFVSQWEKPKEWRDYERSRGGGVSKSTASCDRNNSRSNDGRSSSSIRSSSNRGSDKLDRDHRSSGRGNDGMDYRKQGSSDHRDRDRGRDHRDRDSRNSHKAEKNGSGGSSHGGHHSGGSGGYHRDRNNEFHTNSHHGSRASASTLAERDDMDISSRDATPTSENEDSNNIKSYGVHNSGQPVGFNSAALPQMASHPEQQFNSQISNAHHHHGSHYAPQSSSGAPTSHFPASNHLHGGPPTPTSSELESHPHQLPGNHHSALSAVHTATHSPLTLTAALKPQPVGISPSLGRLYRESLIGHVVGWPADSVEKACQRFNDDHTNVSNLSITWVSAELKMARSLVRMTEIQATLQEQRIMFLRQHCQDLDSIKTQSVHSSALDPSSSDPASSRVHPVSNLLSSSSAAATTGSLTSSSTFTSAPLAESAAPTSATLPPAEKLGLPDPHPRPSLNTLTPSNSNSFMR